MTNEFEADPPLSRPSPKSHIETRMIKVGLDRRIAAGDTKQAVSSSDKIPERPTIGTLPTPPPSPEAKREGPVDEVPFTDPGESGEVDPDEEVTEKTRAPVVIPRQPPIRK